MKLKFVYYFYAPKQEFPLIYDYHFACLKRFNNVFDEVLIVLSVDDITDYDYINSLKIKFIEIFKYTKTLTFKVYKNDYYYREALAFKNEIVDTISTSDSLTFFAHSKGFTNDFNENLKYWTCAMYYFNLRDIEEVKTNLTTEITVFYSYLVMRGSEIPTKYKWHFPGTFYWINCPFLYLDKGTNFPELTNRWYAEMFPGNMYELSSNVFQIHKARWAADYFLEGNYNCYDDFTYLLSLAFSENDRKMLDDFVNDIDREIQASKQII